MEIPFEKRERVNAYIRKEYSNVPEPLLAFERIARALPIPPHHVPPEIGKLLQVLVMATKARSILEIGTMWGYSTWWLHQGVQAMAAATPAPLQTQAQPKIITLEKELKHYNLAVRVFREMEMDALVELRHADALLELPNYTHEQFDFVFLDADKKEYPQLFQLVRPLLRTGGLFVIDNVIYSSNWNGITVADETQDERIRSAQTFNRLIAECDDFTALPLSIGSGVMLAIKNAL